jgi:hypothetical protein
MPYTKIGQEAERIARRIPKSLPMEPPGDRNPMSPPIFAGRGKPAYPTLQTTQANILGVPGEGPGEGPMDHPAGAPGASGTRGGLPASATELLDTDTRRGVQEALSRRGRRIARRTSDAATD